MTTRWLAPTAVLVVVALGLGSGGGDGESGFTARPPSADARLDETEELPFSVTLPSSLRLASRDGTTVTYTDDGDVGPRAPRRPTFTVSVEEAASAETPERPARRAAAEDLVRRWPNVVETAIEQVRDVEVDELPGVELIGLGTDATTRERRWLLQVVLFDERTRYVLRGEVDVRRADVHRPAFERTARSFHRAPGAR